VYQLETKLYLVEQLFNPKDGWRVRIDVDAMELGKGGRHPRGKAEVAQLCVERLIALGATIGADHEYGRADLVARHDQHGVYVVEVEADTTRQKEQAMYSALGQTLLVMKPDTRLVRYGLAVPDDPAWKRQVAKIPIHLLRRLDLEIFLVSPTHVERIPSSGLP